MLPSEVSPRRSLFPYFVGSCSGVTRCDFGVAVELGLLAGDGSPDTSAPGATISLLHLVKQLLRSGTAQTVAALQNLSPVPKEQPSLNLLLRFQRLLIAQIYPHSQCKSMSGKKYH